MVQEHRYVCPCLKNYNIGALAIHSFWDSERAQRGGLIRVWFGICC